MPSYCASEHVCERRALLRSGDIPLLGRAFRTHCGGLSQWQRDARENSPKPPRPSLKTREREGDPTSAPLASRPLRCTALRHPPPRTRPFWCLVPGPATCSHSTQVPRALRWLGRRGSVSPASESPFVRIWNIYSRAPPRTGKESQPWPARSCGDRGDRMPRKTKRANERQKDRSSGAAEAGAVQG